MIPLTEWADYNYADFDWVTDNRPANIAALAAAAQIHGIHWPLCRATLQEQGYVR